MKRTIFSLALMLSAAIAFAGNTSKTVMPEKAKAVNSDAIIKVATVENPKKLEEGSTPVAAKTVVPENLKKGEGYIIQATNIFDSKMMAVCAVTYVYFYTDGDGNRIIDHYKTYYYSGTCAANGF